jgi:hypothetical protein
MVGMVFSGNGEIVETGVGAAAPGDPVASSRGWRTPSASPVSRWRLGICHDGLRALRFH